MPSYRHVLFVIAATACWGVGTVLSKQELERGIGPLELLTAELAASCVLLVSMARVLRIRWTWSQSMTRLAALGALNPGLAYALGLFGLLSVSASLAVLIWATEPVLIAILALPVLGERIRLAMAVPAVVAIAGAIMVLYRPAASGNPIGIALTLAAVAACAFYTVITRRLLLDDSSLVVVLAQQAVALALSGLTLIVLSAAHVRAGEVPDDVITWVLAAASGIVYYGLAFTFYVSGLRTVPATVAGSLLPLIPVFGLAAGYVTGDRLVGRQWLGVVLVVLAALVVGAKHRSNDPLHGSSARRPK